MSDDETPTPDRMIELHGRNAERSARVIGRLLKLTEDQLDAGKVTDPDRAAQRIAVAGGIAFDKWRVARGEPTAITEHRDLDDLLKQLRTVAPGAVGYHDVEGTVEPDPPELEP